MTNCSICGASLRVWKQGKLEDGVICQECMQKLPSIIIDRLATYPVGKIKRFIDYESNPKFKKFSATASYGKLHLDEYNGLFAVCDKLDAENFPKENGCIFYILDLSRAELFCTNPTVGSGERVFADTIFQCSLRNPDVDFYITLKKQTLCSSRRIDNLHVDWNEPGDFSMFRNIFNQMFTNEQTKLKRAYSNNFLSKQQIEVFEAKCLFMVDDVFTEKELLTQRNVLTRAFVESQVARSDYFIRRIENAYQILLPLAVKEGAH